MTEGNCCQNFVEQFTIGEKEMGEEIGNKFHYLDGNWVAEEDCKISVFDITILRGYGVFDFLKTYKKRPFLLDEHVERLFNSAEKLHLTIPSTREKIVEIVKEGIRRSQHDELYIKLIVTGGISPDGITPTNSSLIGLFLKAGTWPESSKTQGIAVKMIPFERNVPESKSLNYMQAVLSLQEAKKDGYQDVLYLSNEGNILEGTTVNFFGVKEGKLYTSDSDILIGITRNFIIKFAKDLEIEVVKGKIPKDQLKQFSESFVCSTTREIHPVVKVNDQIVGDGKPGPVTMSLMDAFERLRDDYTSKFE